jgi:hypothetical protein
MTTLKKILDALASPVYVSLIGSVAALLVAVLQPFGMHVDAAQVAVALTALHTTAILLEKLTAAKPMLAPPSPTDVAIAAAVQKASDVIRLTATQAAAAAADTITAALSQPAPPAPEPAAPAA